MYNLVRQHFRKIYSSSIFFDTIAYNYIKCNYINCQYNDYNKLIEEDVIDYDNKNCISVCENCGLFLSKE